MEVPTGPKTGESTKVSGVTVKAAAVRNVEPKAILIE
jgi:hypothetical protein